jgi:hypothetical protein
MILYDVMLAQFTNKKKETVQKNSLLLRSGDGRDRMMMKRSLSSS